MNPPDSDESYRVYFEQSPVGVFVVDGTGTYVDANPAGCELVGYDRDELLSMSISDIGVEDVDAATEMPSFVELDDVGRVQTEVTLRHKAGHLVDVLFDAVKIHDERLVAYCRDITEQKQYQNRLESQRDNLSVLNQMLRHDIRNDLQVVTGYAELLRNAPECGPGQEFVEKISRSAAHAIELTTTGRQLAEVMLTTEGGLEPIDLTATLETERQEVQSTYPEAHITSEVADREIPVAANGMLGSVFRNLLKNAVQHNDSDVPEIAITAAERDGIVTVRVADNGPGVPADQRESIFGQGTMAETSAGTGIGLYLVRTLVETYGGDVWVESRAEGDGGDEQDRDSHGGAVFVVELPTAG
ncbi:PAS domain-containing sensor histidine kinase [Halobellus sp. Atlit-31R]|nr:PAS domain-containing sensor histidine kinase [Halobellus sp. Atlit-31R]